MLRRTASPKGAAPVGQRLSGGAARAAAADVLRRRVLVDLERVAAAAGRDGIRVVDCKPGLLDRIHVVDLCALQVRRAEGVDDHLYAVSLELEVALDSAAVEAEPVLEAGA